MGQVRDIMQKNVITIQEDKSALDAAKLISEKDISFLVIVKDDKHIGVITERDFVRKIAAQDKQASLIPLSEIMSYKFRWVEPSTEIEDAVQKMLNHNIRRLIVLEDEKLVGVITQTDLADFLRSRLLIEGTIKNIGSENPNHQKPQ
jgi:CBS domain-containing protein